VETIKREQLKAKMERGYDFVVVDTLGEEYYHRSHLLAGAINVPLEEVEQAREMLRDKEAEIVVYSVWFDWDGEQLILPVGTRKKYRNLQRDPRIALSIVDPENPYRYLEIRGEVTRVEEDPNIDFISSMAKKYLGLDRYPYHQPGDERVVVFVRPEHTTQMGA